MQQEVTGQWGRPVPQKGISAMFKPIRDGAGATGIDITADRYLRTLSEAAAADSVAVLVTCGDTVHVAERQGVKVVVAAQAVVEATGTWPTLSRFRLLNYLKAGLVDVSMAAHYGWLAEPVRPGDQDLHIFALQADTGRLLASATLRRPPASAGACMADRDRPLLMVEEAFGIGVYDCMPAVSALHLDQVAEIKRLVRDQDLRGMAGLRVALETIMAVIMAPSYAWGRSVKAGLGDLEPSVVGRLLSFLHVCVHLVNTRPCPAAVGMDARYLSHHFSTGRARPFVLLAAELGSTTRRCAQVRAALALPDAAAAATRRTPAISR
jgi:hypothetical protein